ncbi:hypothetical protein ACS0TY_001516 [Phlomoides rotata]
MHGRVSSRVWNSMRHILSLICLENTLDCGHLKEPTRNPGTITPHLKRGDELEIKFITVASEDMTNSIRYPSFNFMRLQRPDHRSANYIKHQETKLELVVNLTEDEVTTRHAWGVWVCLTEMDKVKYPFKICQNSVN